MTWLRNSIYVTAFLLLSPWLLWRVCIQGKNRRGWRHKLFGWVPVRDSDRPCFWIHAVSVGEINLLQVLVRKLTEQRPDIDIVISTTTESGFDLAQKKFGEHCVFFCPYDFSWSVNQAMVRIRPDCLILTELEIWPNLITVAANNKIPVALINGRISDSSFGGYQRFRMLLSDAWQNVSLFLVQTEEYRRRLIQLGVVEKKIAVTGNLKFDGAVRQRDPEIVNRLKQIAGLNDDQHVFLAGSTQENEDRICLQSFLKLRTEFPNLRLILVPRHPERCGRLYKIICSFGLTYVARSAAKIPASTEAVFVVDVIGELSQWWHAADVGYVGGSIGDRGGQSMIEPAAAGVPVCFGPDTNNFRDVVELLLRDRGAKIVKDEADLTDFLRRSMMEPGNFTEMAERGRNIVYNQLGATDRTIEHLEKLVFNDQDCRDLSADAA